MLDCIHCISVGACAYGAEGKVDGASPRGLWPPDGGGLCRRVVKGKVLKMDGPSAQGFLGLTGPLAPRVADCRSAAMLIKSALREFLPALIVILSRRRRISVQGTYELIDSKYQSAEPRRQALPSHQPLAH